MNSTQKTSVRLFRIYNLGQRREAESLRKALEFEKVAYSLQKATPKNHKFIAARTRGGRRITK